jgi:hypothetical protein
MLGGPLMGSDDPKRLEAPREAVSGGMTSNSGACVPVVGRDKITKESAAAAGGLHGGLAMHLISEQAEDI